MCPDVERDAEFAAPQYLYGALQVLHHARIFEHCGIYAHIGFKARKVVEIDGCVLRAEYVREAANGGQFLGQGELSALEAEPDASAVSPVPLMVQDE